ncbi:hypothetical protein NPIL_215191 [Nephila pilipes]|uniref:Uncharacterized protein n=1 Tax=Nephila pilipes TaxID=299642 RepID=A0A8X6TRU3_NEPPI|nr:hypothetical protein NPIL_215191 [Nephila pilipes]
MAKSSLRPTQRQFVPLLPGHKDRRSNRMRPICHSSPRRMDKVVVPAFLFPGHRMMSTPTKLFPSIWRSAFRAKSRKRSTCKMIRKAFPNKCFA